MMAIHDETLAALVDDLADALAVAGVPRQRGGLAARGMAWAECSGRLADDGWAELRLHHHPVNCTLQAGLLVYEPLARGGRTVPIGEGAWSYGASPDDRVGEVRAAVAGWLDQLAARTVAKVR